MERIRFLEESNKAYMESSKEARRDVAKELDDKAAECKLLQDALEELEQEKEQEQGKIKLKAEQLFEAERKTFLMELEHLKSQVEADVEGLRTECMETVQERQNSRAHKMYLEQVCEEYEALVGFLVHHVDAEGAARIKETERRLRLTEGINRDSAIHSPNPACSPAYNTHKCSAWLDQHEQINRTGSSSSATSRTSQQPNFRDDRREVGGRLRGEYADSCSSSSEVADSHRPTRTIPGILEGLAVQLEVLKKFNLQRWNAKAAMYDFKVSH